ncbi:hypothetical protein BBP40_004161 [Aspergillus hancockii]|nr:hypothetical protein BBP40_004161 [Aspergillus hancockii]
MNGLPRAFLEDSCVALVKIKKDKCHRFTDQPNFTSRYYVSQEMPQQVTVGMVYSLARDDNSAGPPIAPPDQMATREIMTPMSRIHTAVSSGSQPPDRTPEPSALKRANDTDVMMTLVVKKEEVIADERPSF